MAAFLAADIANNALVNVAADRGRGPANAKFQVIDLGKGRVALKAANGRFVSAAGEAAVLKDLAGRNPGDAEIVPMGQPDARRHDADVADESSYLATKPNSLGTGDGHRHRSDPGPQGRRMLQVEARRLRCCRSDCAYA